jgi:CHAT domain-containing protein/tetratricopeptide (TPR) repeat protein
MDSAVARRFASVAAVLSVVASLSAHQSNTADADAEFVALLTTAQQSYTHHDWERSTAAYQALLTAARAKGSSLWEGRGLLGLGRIANETARYGDARRHALDALAIFERMNATSDIGDANTTLGIAANSVNDDAVAKTHYERAVAAYRAAGDERRRVEASFRVLNVSSREPGRLEMYGQLRAEAHGLGDKRLEGHILHAWGDELFVESVYQPAIEKLEAAVVLFQETNSLGDLGTTYNSLGRVFRAHGQLAAALAFQLKALEIHEKGNVPRSLIQSLNAVAIASQLSGNITQARAYFERALAAAEATGVSSYINFVAANLGFLLVETDADVERGRHLLERAIAAGAGHATSGRYAQLSDAYRKLGRLQESVDASDRAVSVCTTPLDCIAARGANGRAQLALGNEAAALEDQKQILDAVEKIHGTLAASDFLKQDFQRLWEAVYSLAIDLHVRRGQFREALEAAELARSRAFLDLLASRELQRSAGQHGPISSDPAADSAQPGLHEPSASSALRSAASAPPPTLDGLTAIAVRLHSTLLAYWVSANNVYLWVVSPDGSVRGASVSISRAKLDELIRSSAAFTRAPQTSSSAVATVATRGDMHITVSPRSRRTWRALYDVLIAPIERELPRATGARLTIVPYGPLLGVPFAALRDARGRYLVERYTIHSVPAGAVLQFTAGRVRAAARAGSVLLVGDPAAPPRIPGEPALPRLAGASEEVRAIARLLPASRATVLTGGAATERRVRTALPGKAVIHFATHGIVRDSNPLASFLALGTAGDDSGDGQLTADKIYELDLDASLIVLSACRSGGGVLTGDGIAGLARAFFYAGTPSVIVSVWDVADQPTNRLLPAFYRHWLNGADKASALRAAQLSLIRSLRTGQVKVTLAAGTFVLPEDPAFWAAFVLLGEPE